MEIYGLIAKNHKSCRMLSPVSPPILVYNFSFRCIWSSYSPRLADKTLPSVIEAEDNTRTVADFLSVVSTDNGNDFYNGVDGNGKSFVVNTNCMEDCRGYKDLCPDFNRHCERENRVYNNACFLPEAGNERFFYGQFNGHRNSSELISYASSLTVVAHEIFHAVTYFQSIKKNGGSPLGTTGVAGSLNESYSDIFAIFVANSTNSDISKWDWNLYDPDNNVIRSVFNPNESNPPQAIHMDNFDERNDIYFNHGIHNLAAYKIITARDNDREKSYLFRSDLEGLINVFYGALKNIGLEPDFSSSRDSLLNSATMRYGNDEKFPKIEQAINDAFDQVGVFPSLT
jgi:Thermolysin metallopeptidase, alpha-helical domain